MVERKHVAAGDTAAPHWIARAPHWIAQAPRLSGRALIKAYRYTLSPLVGFHCRHLPTCSDYADQALARFGLWAGGWMTLARLLRCHPLGTSGLDFVPDALADGAHWYLPWRYARWRGVNSEPGDAQRDGSAGATTASSL